MKKTHPYLSFFCLLIGLVFSSVSYGQIVINEVCSKNSTVIFDDFGNNSDWIEIYNKGNTSVNLSGYFLSDKIDAPQKWQFPNKIIPPQSFLLVFASAMDTNSVYCHSNFKLSSSGETIILSNAIGDEIDYLEIPALSNNDSYGRLEDGGEEWTFFEIPTPQFSNNNGSNYEFASPPTFETTAYFYKNTATIKLSCDEPNCSIRFTRDGNIPDENSELYTTGILLDTTTCIRAVTFSDVHYPSKSNIQTFFINTSHTLPVLAISSEPDYFWDWEEGIFVTGPDADSIYPFYGANFWREVEIPVHVEYFKSENLETRLNVGAKIHGGRASRSKPMKAFRLITDGDFPSSGMNYRFFEDKNIDNFRRLVVRNASGDFNSAHFRDAYLQRYFLAEGLDLDVLAHQPVAVYINGIYWGVMNLREKVDQFYLQNNYGMDRDSIDLLEEDLFVIEGSPDEYIANVDFVINNDLSISSNFEQAQQYFDISNLTDYFIVQSYTNNTDFPNNNIKFWQPKKEGGKWRYLLFDMDASLGRYGWSKASVNNFQPEMENVDSNKFISVLLGLLENENYHNYFVNRYADLMNTTFTTQNLKAETDATVAEINEEMKRHFQKWTWPGYDVWQENRLGGMYRFIEERPAYQRAFIRQYFELENEVQLKINVYPEGAGEVVINTISLPSLPWDGYYYNGVPVTITVVSNNGFTFSHWESISTILEKNPSKQINYNFETDDEITAFFEAKYNGLNLSVSPNPVEENIRLDFTLDKISMVNVYLYDSVGKLIQYFHQGEKNGGRQSIYLKINDLDSGIYFISLETESEIETVKILK